MTDPAPVPHPAPGRSAIAITASSAAVAAPLLLAWFAGAHWLAAAAAALVIAGLHAVWYVSATSRNAPPPPPSPPIPPRPSAEFAAPFREMLDRLADPVLLVEGSDKDDLNARRYLFANAAARDLLRIHRPAGPLTTAMRAPEVLGIVDDALFDARAGDVMYESGGAQDRVWRARRAARRRSPGRASGGPHPSRRDRVSAQRAHARGLPGQRQPRTSHAAGLTVGFHRDAAGACPRRRAGPGSVPGHNAHPGRADASADR